MTRPAGRRPAWIEVDLDAVRDNVAFLVEAVAPASLCAVVKAGGYGHGAVPVARAALAAGAARLAVALPEEGAELREAGIDAPIMVLSEPGPDRWSMCAHAGLEVTVASRVGAAAVAATGGPGFDVHLKVDTGMHRIGVRPDEVVDVAEMVLDAPNLRLASVWTHLAVADDPTHPFTARQLERYDGALAALAAHGVTVPLRHAANSAAALAQPAARYDMVRCGITVYGLTPSRAIEPWCRSLRPALSLRSVVTHLQRVEAGEGISYGLRHVFTEPTTVATLPLGYADGVVRRASALGATVVIGGRCCPLVGVVTMDQCMAAVPDDVRVGDEAVVIGPGVTVSDWAELLGTIPYEVTCALSSRLPRVFAGDRAAP